MKVGELTLNEIKELNEMCRRTCPNRMIRGECFTGCKYFDEKECSCKLSFIDSIYLDGINLEEEIEVDE